MIVVILYILGVGYVVAAMIGLTLHAFGIGGF